MRGERTLSLVPDASEWLRYLGLEDRLVGGTAACPERTGRTDLPDCTRNGLPAMPARALEAGDAAPRDPGVDLDDDAIVRADPDVVIVDMWNERWSADPGAWIADRVGHPVEVWSWEVRTLRDALEQGLRLGRRFGVMERAMRLLGDWEARLMEARHATGLHRRAPDAMLDPVLVLSSVDPPVAAAGWMAEVVDRAAVRLAIGRSGEGARACTWSELAALDLRHVVVSLPGLSADEACSRLGDTLPPGLGDATISCYDGRGRLDRAGPGLYDAILDLTALFHGLPGRDIGDRVCRPTVGPAGTGSAA